MMAATVRNLTQLCSVPGESNTGVSSCLARPGVGDRPDLGLARTCASCGPAAERLHGMQRRRGRQALCSSLASMRRGPTGGCKRPGTAACADMGAGRSPRRRHVPGRGTCWTRGWAVRRASSSPQTFSASCPPPAAPAGAAGHSLLARCQRDEHSRARAACVCPAPARPHPSRTAAASQLTCNDCTTRLPGSPPPAACCRAGGSSAASTPSRLSSLRPASASAAHTGTAGCCGCWEEARRCSSAGPANRSRCSCWGATTPGFCCCCRGAAVMAPVFGARATGWLPAVGTALGAVLSSDGTAGMSLRTAHAVPVAPAAAGVFCFLEAWPGACAAASLGSAGGAGRLAPAAAATGGGCRGALGCCCCCCSC